MCKKHGRWLIAACLAAAAAAASPAPAQENRTDEPFAVTSRGRPAPRGERTVVVLRDSARVSAPTATAPATPPAVTQPPPTGTRPAAEKTAVARAAEGKAVSKSSDQDKVTVEEKQPERPVTAPRTAERGGAERTHQVEWGETWYGIARKYGVTPRALVLANPEVDPERLAAGSELRVPGSSARATPQPAKPRPVKPRVHRVVEGESLWGIARKYGVTSDAVRKANALKDDRVRIGETLVIPRAGEDDR